MYGTFLGVVVVFFHFSEQRWPSSLCRVAHFEFTKPPPKPAFPLLLQDPDEEK